MCPVEGHKRTSLQWGAPALASPPPAPTAESDRTRRSRQPRKGVASADDRRPRDEAPAAEARAAHRWAGGRSRGGARGIACRRRGPSANRTPNAARGGLTWRCRSGVRSVVRSGVRSQVRSGPEPRPCGRTRAKDAFHWSRSARDKVVVHSVLIIDQRCRVGSCSRFGQAAARARPSLLARLAPAQGAL